MTLKYPVVKLLEEWQQNPDLLKPPEAVAPRLAFRDSLTLLVGREKAGKSTLLSHVAACVSQGRRFFGESTTQGLVLWLRLEEAQSTLMERLAHFDAHPRYVAIPDWLPNGPNDIPRMVEEWQPTLVVVDTLSALGEGIIRDPSNSAEWTRLILPLARLAQHHHFAMVLNHHANKSTGEYRDSTAIGACVDHIIETGTEVGDDRIRVLRPKGRWEIPEFRIRYAENTYTLVDGNSELEARVLAFIQENPGCTVRALRLGAGGKAGYVDAALDRLLERGDVINKGHAKLACLVCQEVVPTSGHTK